MAKDKKQDRYGAADPKKDPRATDIDVSADSLETGESDSELDIQALLRKYMPDYDREPEVQEPDEPTVAEPLPKAEDPLAGFAGLDAAFSPATPEIDDAADSSAAEFDFTDNIPSQSEEGELEDEEGIYEDDEEPRRKRGQKKSVFSFLRGHSKKKQSEAEAEPDELEPMLDTVPETEDALPDTGVDAFGGLADLLTADSTSDTPDVSNEPVDADALSSKLMDSMGLDEAPESPVETFADLPEGENLSALDLFAAELMGDTEPEKASETVSSGDSDQRKNDHLTDEEMLRMAEEMLKASQPAPEEVPQPTAEPAVEEEDEDFDPTDINLMVAFGMEDGQADGQTSGKKRPDKTVQQDAHKLGDKLEREKVTREGKKVKLDRPEYVDRSQNKTIEHSYRSKLAGLWIKLGLCTIFTVLLLIFENIEVLAKLFTGTAKQFGGVFDPAVFPVVYAMVSLQLMLFACLCAYEQIGKGFTYLFRGVPRPESMTALMLVAGLLYTIVIARITVQTDEPVMFNFVVAMAALLTLVGDIFITRREYMNFRVISSDKQKYIVCRVSDEGSRGEATAFSEEEDACDVMRIEKTDFIDGFYNRLYTPDGTTNVFMSCAMGVMVAVAVLFGILANVRGGSSVEVARVVCVTMMTLAPLSVFLSLTYPFYRANTAAAEYDSAIIGEVSLSEYSNASIVTFDDKNVFPSYSVKVQNIRIFNNARIDRVLYYAASVFAKAGGPLQDVFEIATLEVGHSDNVQIFGTETGLLAAEVDGVNIIFGSGAALTKKGLKIRKQEMEDDMDLSDELSIMYMFREDKLVAKMYIQYVMDSDIELILGQFQNSGLYGCVRTFDPNIDERMIARKVKMKRMPLKVIRYNEPEEVTAYTEKVDSGLVTSGSPKSLLQIISYCDKVLHTRKTNMALAILAILVGAAIMLLLVLSGSIGIMNSLYVMLYQLLWLIPMLFSSKMFIR